MARTTKTSNTEPIVEAAAAGESSVAAAMAVEENMDEKTEVVEEKKSSGKTKKAQPAEEPLSDSDEIEVMALIPNVSYEDERTSDYWKWEKAGDIETMTFEAIKAMHRKYKSYLRDMWLKPLDERVIKNLGLTRTYEQYDFLMNEDNYASSSIDEVLDGISSVPDALKIAIITRIKNMVADGTVADVKVIRKLENKLDIDLISLL